MTEEELQYLKDWMIIVNATPDLTAEAGAPKIIITAEMIEAGVSRLICLDTAWDSAERIVEEVVSATLARAGVIVMKETE